jgi:two-component SAPR family response regulator
MQKAYEPIRSKLKMMNSLSKLICFLSLLIIPLTGFSQGLQFHSNNYLIDDRTSYHVFDNKPEIFKDFIEISFEFSVIDPHSFGYILYVKDIENNLYYNLTFTSENDSLSYLKLSIESKASLISIPLDKKQLGKRRWHDASLRFDSEKDSIFLRIDQKYSSVQALIRNSKIQPEIYFGKHESFIDVPEIAIKNLELTGKNKSIRFPFNEISGQAVHDTQVRSLGRVENPVWLINESYNWKLRKSFSTEQVSAVNFNAPNQEFIIINKDSLIIYNIQEDATVSKSLADPVPVPMRLGSSFLNKQNNQLYIYEVNDVEPGKPSIASLNMDNFSWTIYTSEQLNRQKHHHVSYQDNTANKYCIFGGFGNKHYSNDFYSFDLSKPQWIKEEFTGDFIPPRFFSGLTSLNNRELILFGGVGNPSGDQAVGKIYYTDCFHIDLNKKSISKLWELADFNQRMVASRNMILSPDSAYFYTLYYPEYIPNTFLSLYKFSIENGSYEILGDSIPMVSERIRTNANIYLDRKINEIYCAIQEFNLDGSSKIRIYSIPNTPVSRNEFYTDYSATGLSSATLLISLLLILIILFLFYFVFFHQRRKKSRIKKQREQIQNEVRFIPAKQQQKKNAVYLFGKFRVLDRNKRDISHLFSPKIKQLFLLILINSQKNRVSSADIYSNLWPDKPREKAKNSKGVILNQLRKILNDIEGIELMNENKKLYFGLSPDFYCDYLDFKRLIQEFESENTPAEAFIQELVSIISQGKFLEEDNFSSIDRLKEEFENDILKFIPYQLETSFKNHNYFQVIEISKILYHIDPTNELAFHCELLSYMKLNMEEKAKKRYNAFIIEYKKENDDDFPHTFRELLKFKSLELIKEKSVF